MERLLPEKRWRRKERGNPLPLKKRASPPPLACSLYSRSLSTPFLKRQLCWGLHRQGRPLFPFLSLFAELLSNLKGGIFKLLWIFFDEFPKEWTQVEKFSTRWVFSLKDRGGISKGLLSTANCDSTCLSVVVLSGHWCSLIFNSPPARTRFFICFTKWCALNPQSSRRWEYLAVILMRHVRSSRVTKCHGYDRSIRVKIFASWGKKVWKNMQFCKRQGTYVRILCIN